MLALAKVLIPIIFLAFLKTYPALASDKCGEVNLAAPGEYFNKVPVMDQASSQICYAFTASQLIGFLLVQGKSFFKAMPFIQEVNPYSIAIRYAKAFNHKDLYQGGVACKAMRNVAGSFVCKKDKGFSSEMEILILSRKFENCLKFKDVNCVEILERYSFISEQQLYQLSTTDFVALVEENTCLKKDRVFVPTSVNCDYTNDETKKSSYFWDQTNLSLNEKFPVELGLSNYLFSYKSLQRDLYKIDRSRVWDSLEFSLRYLPHSVLVIGRKLNKKTKKCQYLVRNTMGRSWCPKGVVDKRRWDCDFKSGGIWINDKELFDATFQVSTIKNQNNRSAHDFKRLFNQSFDVREITPMTLDTLKIDL
jgi:hypothetical protein